MDFYIDQLRTSTHLKNILTRVKTRTGIQNMNVICRWGFCLSLKQTSLPRDIDEKLDGVTIDYDTFAGKNKKGESKVYISQKKHLENLKELEEKKKRIKLDSEKVTF